MENKNTSKSTCSHSWEDHIHLRKASKKKLKSQLLSHLDHSSRCVFLVKEEISALRALVLLRKKLPSSPTTLKVSGKVLFTCHRIGSKFLILVSKLPTRWKDINHRPTLAEVSTRLSNTTLTTSWETTLSKRGKRWLKRSKNKLTNLSKSLTSLSNRSSSALKRRSSLTKSSMCSRTISRCLVTKKLQPEAKSIAPKCNKEPSSKMTTVKARESPASNSILRNRILLPWVWLTIWISILGLWSRVNPSSLMCSFWTSLMLTLLLWTMFWRHQSKSLLLNSTQKILTFWPVVASMVRW